MLCALNFLKGVVHMFIHGFPMFQIFNMRPPILIYWKHTECIVARDWKWTWLWTSQKLPDLIQEHGGNSFSYGHYFRDKRIIAKPLEVGKDTDGKNETPMCRKTLLIIIYMLLR